MNTGEFEEGNWETVTIQKATELAVARGHLVLFLKFVFVNGLDLGGSRGLMELSVSLHSQSSLSSVSSAGVIGIYHHARLTMLAFKCVK